MPANARSDRENVQGLVSIAGRTSGPLSDYADHSPTPNGYLLILADGRDEPGGEPPSRVAIREIKACFSERRLLDPDEAITEAFRRADLAVRKAAGPHRSGEKGMRATVTAIILEADAIHVGHVGDGRAYRIRGSLITRMTTDHTFVRTLVEAGVLRAADARRSRYEHALIRALGGGVDGDMTVAVAHLDLAPGDIVVVCSDGIADVIDDLEVGRLVDAFFPPDAAASALVELAARRGASENLAAIVARIG